MAKDPPGLPPGFPDMPGIPTPESLAKQFNTYSGVAGESVYDDIDEVISLENAGLSIFELDQMSLDTNPLDPKVTLGDTVKIVSPVSGKAWTCSNEVTGVVDGAALYIEDAFPVTGGSKTIKAMVINDKKYRRPDWLFLGVRIGGSLYLRQGVVKGSSELGTQWLEMYTTGVTGIMNTLTSITWNVEHSKTDLFDHDNVVNPEEFKILSNGLYSFEVRVSLRAQSGPVETMVVLQKYNTSTTLFANVDRALSYSSHHGSQIRNSSIINTIQDVEADSIYRVQVKISLPYPVAGETADVAADSTSITVLKV